MRNGEGQPTKLDWAKVRRELKPLWAEQEKEHAKIQERLDRYVMNGFAQKNIN